MKLSKTQAVEDALFVAAFVIAALTMALLLSLVLFPFPLDYGEGPILSQIQRLVVGESLYPYPLQPELQLVTNYPPAIHLILALFGSSTESHLFIGRLLSFTTFLATVALVGTVIFKMTCNLRAAAFGALYVLCSYSFASWSTVLRVDSLAVFLEISALTLVVLSHTPSKTRMLMSALLLCLAFFTKQNHIFFGFVSCLSYLALFHGRSAVTYFLLALATWSMLTLSCFWYFFGLQGPVFHLVQANVNPVSLDHWWTFMRQYLQTSPLIFAALVVYLALLFFPRCLPFTDHRLRVWLLWVALAAIPTVVAMAKIGSAQNYLIHLTLAAAMALGILFNGLRRRWSRLLLLCVLPIQGQINFALISRDVPTNESKATMRAIHEQILSLQGPILSDEGIGSMVMTGKKISYQPFEVRQLQQKGLIPESWVLSRIENQDFHWIVIGGCIAPKRHHLERWSIEQLQAIEWHYYGIGSIGTQCFFSRESVELFHDSSAIGRGVDKPDLSHMLAMMVTK